MTTALAHLVYDTHPYWDGPHHWFPFFPVIPLLIIATVAGLLLWRYRGDHSSAAGIVRRRFANGEISEEELHDRLDALRHHRG